MADEHLRATAALCDQRTLMDLRDYAHSKLLLASRATPSKPEEAREWQGRYEFLRTMLHWAKATQINNPASGNSCDLSFSRALEMVRMGTRVRRSGWPEGTYLQYREVITDVSGKYSPWVAIVSKTPDGEALRTPYVVTQQDLLARDWCVHNGTITEAQPEAPQPEEYRGPHKQAGAEPRSLKQRLASILEYSVGDLIEDDDLVNRVITLMQWPRIATERQDYIDSVAKALDDLSGKVEQREELGD